MSQALFTGERRAVSTPLLIFSLVAVGLAAACTITVAVDGSPGTHTCVGLMSCPAGAASAPAPGASALVERLHSLKGSPP